MDVGEFSYCGFWRWFFTRYMLRGCLCGVVMPESIIVIARDALVIEYQCVACFAG
jgi:hypothetical protein